MSRFHRAASAALITVAAVAASPAEAQDYEGARLLGLGGAQRALTNNNDAIYVNPAGIALGNMYSVEVGYIDDFRGSDRRFNSSVADSQAGPVAGGVAYTYSKRRPDDLPEGDPRATGHRFDLALATRIYETAAIGVTGRYLHFTEKLGDEVVEGGKLRAFTLDAGIQWRIGGLGLGFAGYNLTNSKRPELPIGWGAGIGYGFDALTIEGDVRYNAQRGDPQFTGALGYVIAQRIALRSGVTFDRATDVVTLSAGLGFVLDRVSADIGYRQKLNGPRVAEDDDARIFGVALRGHAF